MGSLMSFRSYHQGGLSLTAGQGAGSGTGGGGEGAASTHHASAAAAATDAKVGLLLIVVLIGINRKERTVSDGGPTNIRNSRCNGFSYCGTE